MDLQPTEWDLVMMYVNHPVIISCICAWLIFLSLSFLILLIWTEITYWLEFERNELANKASKYSNANTVPNTPRKNIVSKTGSNSARVSPRVLVQHSINSNSQPTTPKLTTQHHRSYTLPERRPTPPQITATIQEDALYPDLETREKESNTPSPFLETEMQEFKSNNNNNNSNDRKSNSIPKLENQRISHSISNNIANNGGDNITITYSNMRASLSRSSTSGKYLPGYNSNSPALPSFISPQLPPISLNSPKNNSNNNNNNNNNNNPIVPRLSFTSILSKEKELEMQHPQQQEQNEHQQQQQGKEQKEQSQSQQILPLAISQTQQQMLPPQPQLQQQQQLHSHRLSIHNLTTNKIRLPKRYIRLMTATIGFTATVMLIFGIVHLWRLIIITIHSLDDLGVLSEVLHWSSILERLGMLWFVWGLFGFVIVQLQVVFPMKMHNKQSKWRQYWWYSTFGIACFQIFLDIIWLVISYPDSRPSYAWTVLCASWYSICFIMHLIWSFFCAYKMIPMLEGDAWKVDQVQRLCVSSVIIASLSIGIAIVIFCFLINVFGWFIWVLLVHLISLTIILFILMSLLLGRNHVLWSKFHSNSTLSSSKQSKAMRIKTGGDSYSNPESGENTIPVTPHITYATPKTPPMIPATLSTNSIRDNTSINNNNTLTIKKRNSPDVLYLPSLSSSTSVPATTPKPRSRSVIMYRISGQENHTTQSHSNLFQPLKNDSINNNNNDSIKSIKNSISPISLSSIDLILDQNVSNSNNNNNKDKNNTNIFKDRFLPQEEFDHNRPFIRPNPVTQFDTESIIQPPSSQILPSPASTTKLPSLD